MWDSARHQRNNLLAECDWTQLPDSPLSDAAKLEWQNYRQALRDLPDTHEAVNLIDEVVFPTPPNL